MELIDILDYETFYPSVCMAIKIAITLPVTSCSVERSFSTLSRLETWLRSRMGNERLSSLGLINIHRQRYENKEFFEQKLESIIEKFGLSSKRSKGKELLVYLGYIFGKDYVKNEKTYWKCIRYNNDKSR
ncbi:hypothetical protein QTP88_019271 [Uroleucon formosanum]